MSSHAYRNGFLLLLAAIVLLLQSFAVWHDVEHPFHHKEAQCERLDAIHGVPAVVLAADLQIAPPWQWVLAPTATIIPTLPANHFYQRPIRAPPVNA